MKIAFNPSTVAALTTPPNNQDITFDLRGQNIFARGVKFYGTDTNTWRDIKINNVSIGSYTLDLRNGSNTTLTNTNGVVTINSTWRPVVDNLTSDSTTSSLSAKQGKILKALIDGKSNSDHNHDGKYLKLTGGTMLGALNFANNTWNPVGDDSYIGDCNIAGHFGIKAADATYPGITFFNNANTSLGNLTAYSGNIKYGAYSLQFLDNGNTSVGASTWSNPFSDYNSNAVADGQAICVWGQASYLSNLSTNTGDMTLWLRRVNANAATLNMVLDGEYYAQGSQRLAHVSEIPNKNSWNYDDRYLRLTGGTMSGSIHFEVDDSYDIGSNAAASRFIYTHWLGARSGQKLELGANDSGFGQGLCIDTNLNVGIGTNSPTQKLDVIGNIRATGQLYLPTNGNYNAILMGDDCWMGDCNIDNVIGLSGVGNANSGGIKFGKGGMYIGYNGSNHYSSGASLWSNFNADLLDGLHSTSFAPYNGVKFIHAPDANIWHRILQFTTNWIGQVTFMYSPEECQRSYWGIFNINIRSKDIWFRGFAFADSPQLKCCGDDNNNWSVWIKGNANIYDPYGVIQILNFSNASIVSVGLNKSQTTEPSDTYNKAPDLFQAGSVNWSDITNKIVAGNEFNVVNAGYNNQFWFNFLPLNDRNSKATISTYCMGNGNKDFTSVTASGFIKNGGNENQLLRADGGVAAFNWAGQSGQPTWLWGGNNFNSYYVYNPSNFRVAYASSAGNADTLGGIPRNYGQAPFGTIPFIGNDGVMEIGRYIDFHYGNSGRYDYSTRIQATGDYENTVNLPSASGTLALTSYGGASNAPIFLGYLNLEHGYDGTISSSFYCLGYSVPFTYTRGGNYCKIVIPDTTRITFYIMAAIASVNYSGGGMDTWVGDHRGEGAWWLHCYASGWNEVRVKGFHSANKNNDSWWGGNPLYSNNGGANKITVCIFGYVRYK